MVQKVGRKQTYKTVRASSRSKRTNWGNNQAPRKFERYPFAKISRFQESKTFLQLQPSKYETAPNLTSDCLLI